jgi:hypothetical protein
MFWLKWFSGCADALPGMAHCRRKKCADANRCPPQGERGSAQSAPSPPTLTLG